MGTFRSNDNELPPDLSQRLTDLERFVKGAPVSRMVGYAVGGVAPSNPVVPSTVGGYTGISTPALVQAWAPGAPTVTTTATDTGPVLTATSPSVPSSLITSLVEWQAEVTQTVPGNLLPYQACQFTPTNVWWVGSGTATIGTTTTAAASGYGCGLFTINQTGSGAWVTHPLVTFASTGEQTLSASCWVRSAQGSRQVALRIAWFTDTDTWISTSSEGTAVTTGSSWQLVSCQQSSPPSNARKARMELVIKTSGSYGDKVLIDMATLKPGVTSWSLSPDPLLLGSKYVMVPFRVDPTTGQVVAGQVTDAIAPGPTEYEVRMRARSTTGVWSQWSAGTVIQTTGDTAPPLTKLTGLTVSRGQTTLTVWWDPSTDQPRDTALFTGSVQVELHTNSSYTALSQVKYALGAITGFSGLANGTYWVRVRPVDAYGNNGPWTTGSASGYTIDGTTTDSTSPSGSYRWIAADSLVAFDVRAVNAVFENASISSAKIKDLTADKIKAGVIGAEEIQLYYNSQTNQKGIIRSQTYQAGSAGWMIDGQGNAEFNNVTVRGTVTGSSVTGSTVTSYADNVTMTLAGRTITWAQSGYVNHTMYKDGSRLVCSGYIWDFSSDLWGLAIISHRGLALGSTNWNDVIDGNWLNTPGAIQIITNNVWSGYYPNHTGFLIQCDSLSSWGDQQLRFHRAVNWKTYDTTHSLAIREYCFVRLMNNPGGNSLQTNIFGVIGQNTSRLSQKKDIEDVDPDDAMAIVQQLRPRRFVWKASSDDPSEQAWLDADPQWGFIAEEVADVSHRLAHWSPETSEDLGDISKWVPINWRDRSVVALLVSAVHQLDARLSALESRS